ncbi:MAG: phospholipid carrier-dependent glycosyltransferase [Candidatus Andersenbacteria bacterium]|nr:phospholipid carrier-dependent glycosyltransferase [Candidatus Andersenbacteria bacterium]MBI3250954.1 phospholipid carrier-dependent glycosyltransferase [Candidatus Andersenbacteria bacterium]
MATGLEKQIWIFLGLLGVGLYCLFLNYPNQVIFDEVHFGKFVTAYCCTGERFFDIHPPHAKLLIAGGAKILGYTGGFDFDHIGESYGDISPWKLRAVPALAGALLPLVIFGILRAVGVSLSFSIVGALAIALNNALIVQSRLIGLDSMLLLFEFSAVLASIRGMKKLPQIEWKWWVVAGALSGLALGVKFTGLAAIAIVMCIVVITLAEELRQHSVSSILFSRYTKIVATVLASAFIVYVGGWFLHFQLLTNPGSGDAWGIPTGNFVTDVIKEHKTMLGANYNLTATHPYESKWWQWPVMTRSVFYWTGPNGEWIYFLGNPIIWIGSSLIFLTALFSAALSGLRHWPRIAWIFLAGYLIAYIPLMRVPRALFLYHYLTPLLFAILLGVWWLDATLSGETKKKAAVGLGILFVLGFVAMAPVTYGFNGWQEQVIGLVSSWR